MNGDENPDPGPRIRDLVGIGGLFVGCLVAGLVIGWQLDAWLSTSPVFILAGIAIGIIGAGLVSWYHIRSFLRR